MSSSGRRARRPDAEDDSLSSIAREAEARLAAKRAARAEAREIRLKELEKQQREVNATPLRYNLFGNAKIIHAGAMVKQTFACRCILKLNIHFNNVPDMKKLRQRNRWLVQG